MRELRFNSQIVPTPYRHLVWDHVTVLLATYNGAEFLVEQLNSLLAQTHRNWSLIASDDGSTDSTIDILRDFARSHRDIRTVVLSGPQAGAAQNFLSLLRAAGSSPYVAFADQDDIWLPDKLDRAVQALAVWEEPALYGARTIVFDTSRGNCRMSKLHRRTPCFGNALIQNFAGGNTMVMNRPALAILQHASRSAQNIYAHDWWAYQMLTGAGGTVVYDSFPCLGYRQHERNLIGANEGFRDCLRRLTSICSGEWKRRIRAHLDALAASEELLTEKAREILSTFRDLSSKPALARPGALSEAGIIHHRKRGNIALGFAAMAGRV